MDENHARSVSLGPASEDIKYWVIILTASDGETDPPDDAGVAIRPSSAALHELTLRRGRSAPDAREVGHTAERGLCGDNVELWPLVPNDRDRPVHRRCYREAYSGLKWLREE